MTRALKVVAGLLWVVGIVVLIVAAAKIAAPANYIKEWNLPPDHPYVRIGRPDHGPVVMLYVGIGLVGVSGVLTAGLVLRHWRQRAG